MLRLSNVWKRYRMEDVETVALRDISFTVEAGEFVAITGPSGCGKSTLLNVIGALDRISAGTYEIDSIPVHALAERQLAILRRRFIGFVFQTFQLVEDMTIHDNIELALRYHRLPRAERERKVTAAMQRFGIAHRARHRPSRLSGGQQQRAAIARAIVNSPPLILADEPTGNLDSENGEEVMQLLEELNRDGVTVIMVTHSDTHAERASRRIVLHDGEVVADVRR